jgi:hypothetical protein
MCFAKLKELPWMFYLSNEGKTGPATIVKLLVN